MPRGQIPPMPDSSLRRRPARRPAAAALVRGPLAAIALLALAAVLPVRAAAQSPARAERMSSEEADRRAREVLARLTRPEKFWQLYLIPGDLDSASFDYSRGVFGLQIGISTIAPSGGVPLPAARPASPAVARPASGAEAVGGLAPVGVIGLGSAPRGVAPRELPLEARLAYGRAVARAHAARVDSIQRWFTTQSRARVPIIPLDEALHGLTREGATVFPQAIGLAATFDSALVRRVQDAAATEVRSRGIRMVLSPVVNLADDVRWGRVEETLGEDVFLTSVMGRQHVRAFESRGIVTTPKHFVANVGAGGRDSYPMDLSARTLAERVLPPFQALLGAGARSVMTAYNSVDGSPATQSALLLNATLKGAWGFDGFIISDAAATGGATVLHRTEPNTPTASAHAYRSGLDVVFQSTWPQHRPYLRAVEEGMIPDSVLDASVLRVLRAKFQLGLFDDARVFPDAAAHWAGHATHRAVAREAAAASLVLLRNAPRDSAARQARRGNGRAIDTLAARTLPFGPAVRRLAVIGEDADSVRLGGYSGPGIAPVSILEGIRARAGQGAQVRYVRGPGRVLAAYTTVPATALEWRDGTTATRGLRGEYWANNALSGPSAFTRTDERIDFTWTLSSPGPGLPYDWYSARWTGTLVAPPAGVARLGVDGNDGVRLWLDDRLVLDAWEKRTAGPQLVDVRLAPGSRHALRLEYRESTGNAKLKLVWREGASGVPAADPIAAAVTAARASDAAVVVVGLEEGEFRDRSSLALPGRQEELIRRVAATGVPTVVVIVGGSAVTMSRWLDDVGAVLMAWYPGEEGGPAVADVLWGDVNPSGRLPITFPLSEGQLPLTYDHKPTGRGDDYLDLTGQPLFPFGYGLSYTRFAYDDLRIEVERGVAGSADLSARPATAAALASPPGVVRPAAEVPRADIRVRVRARVRNTGARAGAEVVQLYVRDVLTSTAQPLTQLKGFTRVALAPGESRDVEFMLDAEALRLLDEGMRWVVEPGTFRVMVGASSKDVRLRGEFRIP